MDAYLPREGGQWKQRDNVIRQTLADGRQVIRNVPLPADEALRAFEEQVGDLITAPGAKSEAVQRVIASFGSDQTFTVGDLERLCPTVSRATIKRVLDELRAAGQVECLGKGRAAHWRKAQISS